jgi:hypothetical protein
LATRPSPQGPVGLGLQLPGSRGGQDGVHGTVDDIRM